MYMKQYFILWPIFELFYDGNICYELERCSTDVLRTDFTGFIKNPLFMTVH